MKPDVTLCAWCALEGLASAMEVPARGRKAPHREARQAQPGGMAPFVLPLPALTAGPFKSRVRFVELRYRGDVRSKLRLPHRLAPGRSELPRPRPAPPARPARDRGRCPRRPPRSDMDITPLIARVFKARPGIRLCKAARHSGRPRPPPG